jgi:hypothetical protein
VRRHRHEDDRHWLDKGRYAYPLFIFIGVIAWYAIWYWIADP